MGKSRITFEYEEATETVFCGLANVPAQTREDIDALVVDLDKFWRANCRGRRVYLVVDYTNYRMNITLLDAYADMVKRVLERFAITIVRFGGDELQRTSARLVGMKLHVPSRCYATKEEAIAVVAGLRSGKISIEPPRS